jgi:hypothetical protein
MLEILIGKRWVKVPKDRILIIRQPSPDGGVDACYSDPAPLCTASTRRCCKALMQGTPVIWPRV